jgi:DNA-binding response OmpR family regulator
VRLLIVDDSPLIRRMYGLAFYRHKHELVEAENGREDRLAWIVMIGP